MLTRLAAQDVPRWVEHRRAMKEFAVRLKTWSGEELPEAHRVSIESPPVLPVRLSADPIELLIVRAITSSGAPAFFASDDGATQIREDPNPIMDRYSVRVTGLSPLLDRVTEILCQVRGGGAFFEENGQFITAADIVFADLEPYSKELAIQPDWHPISSPEPVHELVVYGATGIWQSSGVLGKLGYKVGRKGLSCEVRRRILANAIAVKLIPATPYAHEYVTSWGPPASRVRVDKVLSTIEEFSDHARTKHADYSKAIADWDKDQAWLRSTYR